MKPNFTKILKNFLTLIGVAATAAVLASSAQAGEKLQRISLVDVNGETHFVPGNEVCIQDPNNPDLGKYRKIKTSDLSKDAILRTKKEYVETQKVVEKVRCTGRVDNMAPECFSGRLKRVQKVNVGYLAKKVFYKFSVCAVDSDPRNEWSVGDESCRQWKTVEASRGLSYKATKIVGADEQTRERWVAFEACGN